MGAILGLRVLLVYTSTLVTGDEVLGWRGIDVIIIRFTNINPTDYLIQDLFGSS